MGKNYVISDYLKDISDALKSYVADVDVIAHKRAADLEKYNTDYEEAQKIYKPEALNDWNNKRIAKMPNYKNEIDIARNKYKPQVAHRMKSIKQFIDDFYNAHSNQEFCSKIANYKIMGIQPSNAEFEYLKQQAKSYTEMRMLKELANARTKTEEKTTLATDENGNVTDHSIKETVEVSTPYTYNIPEIDAVLQAYTDLEASVTQTIDRYTGPDAVLKAYVDGNLLSKIQGDTFHNNQVAERFVEDLGKCGFLSVDFPHAWTSDEKSNEKAQEYFGLSNEEIESGVASYGGHYLKSKIEDLKDNKEALRVAYVTKATRPILNDLIYEGKVTL